MRVEKQRRSREKRGYGTASRRKVPNRAARQRHCGAWYRAAMAKRDSALRRKAKARLSNAMRWHSNELRHEAQKGKKQRMKEHGSIRSAAFIASVMNTETLSMTNYILYSAYVHRHWLIERLSDAFSESGNERRMDDEQSKIQLLRLHDLA